MTESTAAEPVIEVASLSVSDEEADAELERREVKRERRRCGWERESARRMAER